MQLEALGLGPGVAHLEAGYGRGGGQDRYRGKAGSRSAGDDPDVDHALAPAVERGVEEGPEPGDAVLGAGEPAVEHVERAAEYDEGRRGQPHLGCGRGSRDAGDEEADDGQGVGCEPESAGTEGDGSDSATNTCARRLRDE